MNDAEIHHQDMKDLLSIARHALQTPLGAIRQTAGLIFYEMDGESKARFNSDFKTLEDAIGQLNGMLGTLWQVLEVDSRYSKRESVDLQVVIQRAQARAFSENTGRVVTDIPDNLPLVIVNAKAIEEAICILFSRVLLPLGRSEINLTVRITNRVVVLYIQNNRETSLDEDRSVKDFLQSRENFSFDLLLVWHLIRSQDGDVQVLSKADYSNVGFRLLLPHHLTT
jgi:K+-sensing histidine kinase KdpD